MGLVEGMGFDWVKSFVSWASTEPSKGSYHWDDCDNVVNAAEQYGLKVLFRVDHPPAWANGTGRTDPPTDPADFGDFMYALADRYKGRVAAYEIWNEPNLDYEWGNRPPDPAGYVALLKAVYPRVKEADPHALVVTAGLSTAGEGSEGAMGDLIYLRRMYDAGAKDYFDVLGSHPYGGPYDPDRTTGAKGGMCFYRAKQQHDVMVEYGDDDKKVWATEFGWVLKTGCDLGYHNWMKVSEEEQATYLVQAYQKAHFEWPWMEVMFLFNLDFATVPWYGRCRTERWYSIVYRDDPSKGGPIKYRQAYYALKAMPKPPLPLTPRAYLPAVFKNHLSP